MNENHEHAVWDIVQESLNANSQSLATSGLTARLHELHRYEGVDGYQSEVTIDVLAGDDIYDVIEFFPVRDGRPTATLDETREWLQNAIREILRSRMT